MYTVSEVLELSACLRWFVLPLLLHAATLRLPACLPLAPSPTPLATVSAECFETAPSVHSMLNWILPPPILLHWRDVYHTW